MPIFLNIISAFVCVSMARSQGRRSVRWFFLGLFFSIFAVAALYFMGRRSRRGESTSGQSGDLSFDTPQTPSQSPGQTLQQQGQVDLNALRAAVSTGGMRQQQPVTANPSPDLEPDRQAFLDLVESVAPNISFPGLTPQLATRLRDAWLRLGREFVQSDEGGGITDSHEFYQVELDGQGAPVLFYPVIRDGSSSVDIQFACPVKRFRDTSEELATWVSRQPAESFAVATLFTDQNAGETVLLAAGVIDPATAPVNASTIGQLCRHVRSEANDLRRDIPARFGGIWINS